MVKGNSNSNFLTLLASIVLILCVALIFKMQKSFFANKDCITVSATAKKEVIIDKVNWYLTLKRKGNNLEDLQKTVSSDKLIISQFLKDNGITEDEIEMNDFVGESLNQETKKDEHFVGSKIIVKTKNIPAVYQMRAEMGSIYAQGVVLVENSIEAVYSNIENELDELDLIAAKNARVKAHDLAKGLKVKDGKILSLELDRHYIYPQMTSKSVFNTEEDKKLLKRDISATATMKIEIK